MAQTSDANSRDPYLEIPPPYLPDSRASSPSELWKSAVSNISARLQSDPNQAALYFARGNAYAQLGQFPAALHDYAQAIALAPIFAKAYAARSWLEANNGQRTDALADAERAIAVAPGEFAGYVAKARCLELQMGGYEEHRASAREAVVLLTKAIELEPTLQDLYLQRARIAEAQGDPDGVIKDMTELIRLAPTMFSAYEIRARSWRTKGDIAREAQDLARAGELAGGPRGYYDYTVSVQLDLEGGNFARAVETATAALAIQPNSVDALILRGLANDKRGSLAAASADYDKALEVDPKAPSVMLARADLLKQSGQAQQSTRILQRIIEFADKRLRRDSTDGGAYYVRYEANQLLGNRTAADGDLKKAQQYYKPD